jgi:hypothetical protein
VEDLRQKDGTEKLIRLGRSVRILNRFGEEIFTAQSFFLSLAFGGDGLCGGTP